MSKEKTVYRLFDDLTPRQQKSVLKGSACGHPSNRPKSKTETKKLHYEIDEDGKVCGVSRGGKLSRFFPTT